MDFSWCFQLIQIIFQFIKTNLPNSDNEHAYDALKFQLFKNIWLEFRRSHVISYYNDGLFNISISVTYEKLLSLLISFLKRRLNLFSRPIQDVHQISIV